MGWNRQCEQCCRRDYRDAEGKVHALEVCRDVDTGWWLCKRCFFEWLDLQSKSGAVRS